MFRTRVGLFAALLLCLSPAATRAEDAQAIVAKADQVRNPQQPFRGTTALTEYKSGQPINRNVLLIFSKIDPATHQFFNLVRYIDPPRDAGKMVLLGHVLWFYDPASKTSVRISPQQRLTGQAAIGDVLTANFAIDYTATLDGLETIADADRVQRQTWHLDMKAASENATYNRVEYWVEQGSHRPIKAKFYSDSGRLLKILYYRNFSERLGAERPGGAVIIDAVDSSLVTTVEFSDSKFQDVPDAWFQRDYLPHLNVQ
ncbi:MAG: outer membrane lipoprotein-sorting protein [Proteobacteria bacterium]|nr:outer membrane lipoprotein-sorting protein [Pseudomonadota bacterium]